MKCFPFHDWNKWTRPLDTFSTGNKIQYRECKVCGKAQKRIMFWDHQISASAITKGLDEVLKEVIK